MGKKLHKAEQSEIDFVKSQGGSPNYNDVEKHISDIAEIFDTSEDEFSEEDLRDSLEDDFEDKVYEATNVSGNLKSNHIILKTHVDIVDNINKMNTMVELSNNEIKNIVKVVRYFCYTDSQLCLYYYPFSGKVCHIAPINLVDVHSLPKKSNELLKYSSLLTKDEEAFLKLNINIDRVTPYV